MTSDAVESLVGARHHHRCVPAGEVADASLEVFIARVWRFLVGGDGVDVVGHAGGGHGDAELLGSSEDAEQDAPGAVRTARLGEAVERVEPFLYLAGVSIGQL